MRTAALLATSLLMGCTSTTLLEPRLFLSPYYAIYQLRGDMAMQSSPGAGSPLQDNAAQDMRTFGQDGHEDDVGVRADFGDGFAGLRVDYYRLDMETSKRGLIDADFGRLRNGDIVRMNAAMDELRLGWVEPLVKVRTEWRDRPLTLQFAAGGVFAHRDMALRARTDDGLRSQNAIVEGDVVYAAARFRASWREIDFDAEYAISPEIRLGGDFDGVQQDLELRGSYSLPMRDVTLFAGYRYSVLEARGDANGFAYDADLQLDGFQLGIVVTF